MLNELRAWCKKVLPLAYSEALSYYEALNKIRKKVNEIIDYVNELGEGGVYTVNGKEPIEGNVDVGTVTSINNTLPDENGNVSLPTVEGVSSVNNKTGAVTLDASDVGALPNNYTPPVSSVNNKTGAVNLTASDVGAMPNNYTPPVSSVNNKTGAVSLDASDVGALPNNYTPPVSSVNNKTGAVNLTASDVGAMPNNYTPPVSSVNNKTGAVSLDASDVGALADDIVNGKNIKVVAGVARYINGEWGLLNDNGHNPLNAIIASGQTDPGTFNISHDVGASKVLSLVCGPDEGYAAQGVTCGASVGLGYSVVNVCWPKMAASVIGYNGSAYTHAGAASISSEDIVSSVSMGSHATLGNYLKVNLTKAYPGLINVFSSNQYEWKVLGYGLNYINIQPYLNGTRQNLPLASGAVSLTVAKQTTGVPETIDHTGCNIWFLGIFEI